MNLYLNNLFLFQDSRPLFSPHFPQHCQSPSSTLSPGGYKDEEPRKRAPRALTGRYVRTGTAASPRVLQILRKKVEDRLKLKELLGENSHLYFGAVNKQQSQYKPLSQKIKKKFWKLWSDPFICVTTKIFSMCAQIISVHFKCENWTFEIIILAFYTQADAQCFNSKYFIEKS